MLDLYMRIVHNRLTVRSGRSTWDQVFLLEVFSLTFTLFRGFSLKLVQGFWGSRPGLSWARSHYLSHYRHTDMHTPCHATMRDPECMSLWTRHSYVRSNTDLNDMVLQELKRPNLFFHGFSSVSLRLRHFFLISSCTYTIHIQCKGATVYLCTHTHQTRVTYTHQYTDSNMWLLPSLYPASWHSPLANSMPTYFATPSGRGLKGIWNCLP